MWPFALVAIVFLLVAFSGRAAAQSQPVAVTPCPLSAQYYVPAPAQEPGGMPIPAGFALRATAGQDRD